MFINNSLSPREHGRALVIVSHLLQFERLNAVLVQEIALDYSFHIVRFAFLIDTSNAIGELGSLNGFRNRPAI